MSFASKKREEKNSSPRSCSFFSVGVNLYNAFMLSLSAIVYFGLEVLYILPLAFKLSMVLRLKHLP
jgi:hypothetical protein